MEVRVETAERIGRTPGIAVQGGFGVVQIPRCNFADFHWDNLCRLHNSKSSKLSLDDE